MHVEEIETIGVIGAGVMGAGIAQVFAQAGYHVRLYARHHDTLEQALARMRANQTQQIADGRLTAAQVQASRARLLLTTRLEEAVQGVQLMNESIPEDLTLKRDLFQRLEVMVSPETLLASNTSSLPITTIAEGMRHPSRVLGLHWINPPQLIPIVEVVLGAQTDAATAAVVAQVAQRSGKMPIMVRRDVPGFVWNRLQFALVREALHLLQEGVVTAHEIDQVTAGLGARWAVSGPLQLLDLAGLPLALAVGRNLYPALSQAQEPPPLVQALVTQGHLGARTLHGFYTYHAGEPEQIMAARDAKLWRLLQTLGGGAST